MTDVNNVTSATETAASSRKALAVKNYNLVRNEHFGQR